ACATAWRLASRFVEKVELSSSTMRSPFFVSMPSCAIHLIDVCHCGSRGTANSSPRAARNSPVMTTSLANVPRRTRSDFESTSERYPEKHPEAITATANKERAFTFMRSTYGTDNSYEG